MTRRIRRVRGIGRRSGEESPETVPGSSSYGPACRRWALVLAPRMNA